MVVFTCGHCGESVQKPKVEKHYMTKCRNRNPNLSCMDCFKDFLGNDYENHTKCITEEERYSGKGFQAKEKKGEKKQNAWVEMLQSVLDEQNGLPSNVLRIIETIRKHNNTPRKKPKFVNFVKNVCGHKTNPKDIDQAWDLISVKLADLAIATNPNNVNKDTNGTDKEQNDSVNDSVTLDNSTAKNGVDATNENKIGEETQNGNEENDNSDNKKLSKKQRKEEKKRKKYEAELQSAEAVPEETEEPETQTKKGKKKKNKSISEAGNGEADENGDEEGKGKNKKRKRLDTQVQEAIDAAENVQPAVASAKDKNLKKKLKVEDDYIDQESETLHNQNVAKIEELSMKNECFDWHAVIISVLQKKDNEMPFKRLQKKVLSEYMDATGRDVDDRIADKFIKKLKSAPKVKVDKNRVTLEI